MTKGKNKESNLTKFDKECLNQAIEIARETCQKGVNYPVGAILAIDGKIIGSAGNEINKQKSFVNHAENLLIIRNGEKLYDAAKEKKIKTIYSTLEPCLQCLGACVANNVDRIVYIQKDPNGGACDVAHDNIGNRYREFWPEIIHVPISDEPKNFMISFFRDEIKRGNIEWPTKMLGYFGEKK